MWRVHFRLINSAWCHPPHFTDFCLLYDSGVDVCVPRYVNIYIPGRKSSPLCIWSFVGADKPFSILLLGFPVPVSTMKVHVSSIALDMTSTG